MPKRFGKYGLRLHPKKTRLVRFERPARLTGNGREQRTSGERPETFDLLGFTHHWDVSLKKRWYVRRETAKTRLTRALTRIRQWCREHRHDSVADQTERAGEAECRPVSTRLRLPARPRRVRQLEVAICDFKFAVGREAETSDRLHRAWRAHGRLGAELA